MITEIRQWFNKEFTDKKYEDLLRGIHKAYNASPNFRVAESPIFIDKKLKSVLLEACEEVGQVIFKSNFKEISQGAIFEEYDVPNETEHTTFLQMDFGICKDENGELIPQLIEVQGFPSLYFFQYVISEIYRTSFNIPSNFNSIIDLTSEEYVQKMKEVIVGDSLPENVVMLEIEPEKQNTYIDFVCTEGVLGIKILCVSNVLKEGNKLFYKNEEGRKVAIKKIYNRVIFDELEKRDDLKRNFSFKDELDVEWIGHPNWFFRISKYILPFIKTKYNPESFHLSKMENYPEDLENYVLKPIFSFAGTGVKLNIRKEDLDAIDNKENFILQKKVKYEPVIPTMDEPAKCEIRMLYIWKRGAARPILINNLVRLSKGEMIGVKYNKDKTWVGGSVAFFEE